MILRYVYEFSLIPDSCLFYSMRSREHLLLFSSVFSPSVLLFVCFSLSRTSRHRIRSESSLIQSQSLIITAFFLLKSKTERIQNTPYSTFNRFAKHISHSAGALSSSDRASAKETEERRQAFVI